MKKYLSGFLAASLFMTAFLNPSASEAAPKLDYVAFGDSLASGQTPYGVKVGTSYTDLIAAELETEGYLSSFTKEFALSGETSTQFLAKLSEPNVQTAIQEAELITISTGANDLIPLARLGSADPVKVLEVLAKIDQNLTAGISRIKQLNPSVDIYVTGYYFPFPAMEEGPQKENFKKAFALFNNQLKTTSANQRISFVDVAATFNASYLPNPNDIHPNEAGYQFIADQFFTVWKNEVPVPGPGPGPAKYPFSDIHTINPQGRLAIITLAEAGIIKGNTNGVFLPKSNITRAETAIILARALRQTGKAPNPGFSDVSPSMSSYEAIAKLTEAGIFSKAPKFNPNKPLTRAQTARVFTQALGLKAGTATLFTDVPANHWAKKEIDAVYAHGIMRGGTNAKFLPENNITREQFAMTVYNVWSRSLIGKP